MGVCVCVYYRKYVNGMNMCILRAYLIVINIRSYTLSN